MLSISPGRFDNTAAGRAKLFSLLPPQVRILATEVAVKRMSFQVVIVPSFIRSEIQGRMP